MKKYKRIYIEITNICNLSCDFCPKTTRKKEFMGEELFAEILKKIKGASEYVYFHVMGEPLLHPQLGRFLDLCGEQKFKVNLTTNGTLIEKSDFILSKPGLRQVNFSLHSRGGAGSMDVIFAFADKAAKAGKLISYRLWNLKDGKPNQENEKVFSGISEKYGVKVDLDGGSTPVRGIKLAENVFLNQADEFEWPVNGGGVARETGYCYGLREQTAILVDGTVAPCCLDSEGAINLGSIKDGTLESIVNGKRAKAMYDGFSRRVAVEELCKKCGYRERFDI